MKNFAEVFKLFTQSKNLSNTFAESIYKGFELIDEHKMSQSNNVILRIKVTPNLQNIMGVIHGGALTTIIDTSTTLAILKCDPKLHKTVSVELSTSFLNPAKVEEYLLINAICTKLGKNIAFSRAEIYEEKSNKLIATGSHVKAVIKESSFI